MPSTTYRTNIYHASATAAVAATANADRNDSARREIIEQHAANAAHKSESSRPMRSFRGEEAVVHPPEDDPLFLGLAREQTIEEALVLAATWLVKP